MSISIAELLEILVAAVWRRWRLIVLPILIFGALSVAAVLLWPLQYQAHALLMLQEGQASDPLSSGDGPSRQGRLKVEEIDTLLKSDRVLAGAINDMNVGKKPLTQRDIEGEMKSLRKQIGVSVVGSEFIDVEFRQAEREGIGERLSIIMTRFFEHLLTREYSMKTAREFALDQRRRDVVSTDKAIEDWIVRAEANRALGAAGSNKPSAAAPASSKDDAEGTLAIDATQSVLAEKQRRYLELENKLVVSGGTLLPGVSLANLSQAINEELRALSSRSQNIEIDGLSGRISALKEIAAEADAYRALGLEMARLRTEKAQGIARTIKQSGAIASDKEVAALYNEWESLAARYTEALEQYDNHLKRAKKSISPSAVPFGLIAPESIRIIDEPRDPALPATSALKILVACLAAGIGLGVGLAALAEQFDDRIYDPRSLRKITGVDAVFRVPVIDTELQREQEADSGGGSGRSRSRSHLAVVT